MLKRFAVAAVLLVSAAVLVSVGIVEYGFNLARAEQPPANNADRDKPKAYTPDEAELAMGAGGEWAVVVRDERPEFKSGERLLLGHRGPATGLWLDTRRTTDAKEFRGPQLAVMTQRMPFGKPTNWAGVALWSGKNLSDDGGRIGGTPDLVVYADDDGAGFQFRDSKGKLRNLPVARLEKLLEPGD